MVYSVTVDVWAHATRMCDEVVYGTCVVTLRGVERGMHGTRDICRKRFTM